MDEKSPWLIKLPEPKKPLRFEEEDGIMYVFDADGRLLMIQNAAQFKRWADEKP